MEKTCKRMMKGVCFEVVAIAGCGDKWAEFCDRRTAAARGAWRRGSWGKTRAALKSQLPTMYTAPRPPSFSCYLPLSAIQHGTHLSLMAHWDSHTCILPCTQMPTRAHTEMHGCMCAAPTQGPTSCVCDPLISPLTLCSFPASFPYLELNTNTHTQAHTDSHSSYFNASEGEALSCTAGGHPCKSRKLQEHALVLTLPLPRTHTPAQYLHTSKAKHKLDNATAGTGH